MDRDDDHRECLDKLVWATEALNLPVALEDLDLIATAIVQTMTGPWRYFHTPEHIFEVGGQEDPIEVLSALFHDLVYVQVDRSVNFNLSAYITPYVVEIGEELKIRERDDLPDDRMLDLVMAIFGYVPGQTLSPYTGMNEFLSALAAAEILQSFMGADIIAQIVACIEGTIPFRNKNAEGQSNCDILFDRLKTVNVDFALGMSEAELVETVQRSVRLANRDVGSFAEENPARFLDNTWSLLPETNHTLKLGTSYTVLLYREALQKMEGFMNILQPEQIFHQFRNVPPPEEYHDRVELARRNLEIGRLYLSSKLFTIVFLEALSLRFGKDIPLSMLMGEMPTEGFNVSVLADFLPDPSTHPFTPRSDVEEAVLKLAELGRTKDFDYDTKNSPLTTYMIKAIGYDEILRLLALGKKFIAGELDAEDFLLQCDAAIVADVTDGLGKLFDSRKAALTRSRPA